MLTIKQRTNPNESPYMVDDSGTIVFWCNYKHEADAFIKGVKYQQKKPDPTAIWTDYENRFEVQEKDGLFFVHDYATNMILGGNLFKSELEAEDYKAEFIEYDKQQERYFNKSGR